MTVMFKARIQDDGTIAVPRKLKKKIQSKVVAVTVTEVPSGPAKGIFDEWLRNPIRVAKFEPFKREEIYADRCR
jgi:hypothetical protein